MPGVMVSSRKTRKQPTRIRELTCQFLAGIPQRYCVGMVYALLEEVAINPTIELPELTEYWGNRLLEGTNRTLCTPGPRRKEQ